MAVVKTIKKMAQLPNRPKPDTGHHKGKDFMAGLKNWITSPGGIITLILVVGTLWYVHSSYEPKKAK